MWSGTVQKMLSEACVSVTVIVATVSLAVVLLRIGDVLNGRLIRRNTDVSSADDSVDIHIRVNLRTGAYTIREASR